jgi:hypothetical protein
MAWTHPTTLPVEPRSDRWWVDRWIYQQEAVVADARRAAEQAKRVRQLRRRVERIDEQILLAQSASDARRYRRQQGLPYEPYEKRRSDRLGPIEYGRYAGARVLRVY